jgi:hypothetical protein
MKKITVILFAMLAAFSLSACNKAVAETVAPVVEMPKPIEVNTPAVTSDDAETQAELPPENAVTIIEVIPPTYDGNSPSYVGNGLFTVNGGEQVGLVNKYGEAVPLGKYDSFGRFEPSMGLLDVWRDSKRGALDLSFNEAIPCIYDSIQIYNNHIIVSIDHKVGLVNIKGEEIAPIGKYDFRSISEDFIWVEVDEASSGLIDKGGNEIIAPGERDYYQPTSWWYFYNGISRVQKSNIGMWGAVDTAGNEVIPLIYDEVVWASHPVNDDDIAMNNKDFGDGLIIVKNRGGTYETAVYDNVGNIIVPLGKYGHINHYDNGLAIVANPVDGRLGLIDTKGKEVIELGKYEHIQSLSSGFTAFFERDDWSMPKWGIVDKTGNVIVSPKYDSIGLHDNFDDGFIVVELDGKCGIVDTTGNEIVTPEYDSIGYPYAKDFISGFIIVELDGKKGFVDTSGNEIVPPKYDRVFDFFNGFAEVELDGKYGFVDTVGNEIVSPKYDSIYEFSDGIAGVQLDGELGYIDENGNEIVPLGTYDDDFTFRFCNGFAPVYHGGKWGLIDKMGNVVLDFEYEMIDWIYDWDGYDNYFQKEILVPVKQSGKWGFLYISHE